MDIDALEKIVKTMNLTKIQKFVEESGYRLASKNGVWEFNPTAIVKAKTAEQTEFYEDVFDDKKYVGEIYQDIAEYPNMTFILITVEQIHRHLDNYSFPNEMLLFTNAPINNEYENEQNQFNKCKICKKNFSKKEITEINGVLVCDNCFKKDTDKFLKTGKSFLTSRVKNKPKK